MAKTNSIKISIIYRKYITKKQTLSLYISLLHTLLHQQLVFVAYVISSFDLLFDELQDVQRADRAFCGSLKTSLNAR